LAISIAQRWRMFLQNQPRMPTRVRRLALARIVMSSSISPTSSSMERPLPIARLRSRSPGDPASRLEKRLSPGITTLALPLYRANSTLEGRSGEAMPNVARGV